MTSTAMSCTPMESLQQQHLVVYPSLFENPASKPSSPSADPAGFAPSAFAPLPIFSLQRADSHVRAQADPANYRQGTACRRRAGTRRSWSTSVEVAS
eukprot:COSAG02_NODE_6102_length_3795_cov_11.364989_1_plen_97_part_00